MAVPEFDLQIVTPEGVFLQSKATLVELQTASGQIGVMAGHQQLITDLAIGDLTVHRDHEHSTLQTGGGYVEVRPDQVLVLAVSAINSLDATKLQDQRDRVSELRVDTVDAAQIQDACERARYELARNWQGGFP